MFDDDNDSTGKLIWFLSGAAIGAAIALLYAPQSGAETRKLISRKAGEGRDALSETGKDLMDRGRDLFDRGKAMADEAADMFERGRKMVDG